MRGRNIVIRLGDEVDGIEDSINQHGRNVPGKRCAGKKLAGRERQILTERRREAIRLEECSFGSKYV